MSEKLSDEELREIAARKFGVQPLVSMAAELIALRAERAKLEAALRRMLRAVCGESGFANAVRAASGIAWPWPALEIAEENARAALAQPAESATLCIACAKPLGERQTFIPTPDGPMHPSCF